MRAILLARPLRKVVIVFDPPAGAYTDSEEGSAFLGISASEPVVWNWTRTAGSVPSCNVANGGTAQEIGFSVNAAVRAAKTSSITVTSGDKTWHLELEALPVG